MLQNVNLYQLEVKEELINLTADHIFKACAGLIGLLLLISGYLFASFYFDKYTLSKLELKQTSVAHNLEETIAKIPSKEEQEQLVQKVAALEAIKGDRERMFATLSGLQHGEWREFSQYLSALATHQVPNIWLTSLKISASGKFITLTGKTTDNENVPMLINNLGKKNTFKGKKFETFNLSADPANEKLIDFTIKSE